LRPLFLPACSYLLEQEFIIY